MSLNKDMHPRNPYKDKPPDFKQLAIKFPEFRKHCTMANNGKVHVNFRDDSAVRCLTQTLLKNDFNLDVDLPLGSLVPRIPQKLNYILFIEDLLNINGLNDDVIGIDIGTGASCIYPLLGSTTNHQWKFVATDGDQKSVEAAHKNVARNNLSERICVALVNPNAKTVLMDMISEVGNKTFTFCMCNPPFFETTDNKFCAEPSLGGEKYSNRVVLEERSAPHSITFASSAELQVPGGEVDFVNRIIDDSIVLRDRVKIYTSMLGRKQSLKPLRSRLERLDVKLCISTLNQGKTQRWIIAWTFIRSLILTPIDKKISLTCPAPGMLRLENQLKALDAVINKEELNSMICECKKVTWTHQRARRRAEARNNPAKRLKPLSNDQSTQTYLGSGDGRDSLCNSGNFVSCDTEQSNNTINKCIQAYFPVDEDNKLKQGIKFRATVRSIDESTDEVNFELISGSKHHLHQLLQYLRNVINVISKS